MTATVADDRLADLGGQLGQLALVHAAQVGGSLEVGQDGHVGRMLRVGRSLSGRVRATRSVNLFLAGRQFRASSGRLGVT